MIKLKNLKKVISITVLILIVVLCGIYIYTHFSDFKQLSLVRPEYIFVLLVFGLFNSWTNGLIIKYVAEPFDIKLKFKEWFGLSIITSFYNLITPFKGGLAAKAVYLKQRHNFSYTNFLATWMGIYVINFFAASFLGLISLYFIYLKYNIFNVIVLFIFLAFLIPTLIIILFSPEFKETKHEFINKFIRVLNGWNIVRKNKKIVVMASIIIIAQILINSFSCMIAYDIFNIKIGIEKAIFLSTISIVGILVQITPAGLGINEVLAVFFGLVVGITPAQALTVAILGRIISVLIMFTLGPIYSFVLIKKDKVSKTGV
ncbi:MAG TPA: lysylphosphatidylglycerol synthase transmembrane domain-containing protein [Candidatus Goldiibacteriota bacterium]|nr:lysylphosphatidylglycerol synthase transmembrane domain-containing protein [Candidatus Goldiibacteriota bacterium]